MAAAILLHRPISDLHSFSDKESSEVLHSNNRLDKTDNVELKSMLQSFQVLLNKYKMSNSNPNTQVSSGGLQQFISRKLKQKETDKTNAIYSWTDRLRAIYSRDPPSCVLTTESDNGSYFQCLPVDLKLHIFSLLDSRSLCQACCVCRYWSQLSCDPSLWRRLLQRDMRRWSQISHLTNPQVYQEVESDWSYKEIYLKCSPDFQRQLRASMTAFQQVSSVLRRFISRKIPRVAMFGPGLESSTSGLVRRLLYEQSETFRRIAMFPGQFEGVGGGITLRLPAGHTMHLSVLYSASKQERERRDRRNRLEGNKLLQRLDGVNGNETDVEYELKPQIRHLCQTLDALMFVVDATQDQSAISSSRVELQAMMRERKSSPMPVIVLSCVPSPGDSRLPTCDIVSCLDLASLTQPWMVIDCVSDTLDSIEAGFVWIVEQAQYVR